MNERFKELEKQCWSHRVDGVLVDGHLHFDTKKFAELIVRECVEVMKQHSFHQRTQIAVLEHFGVEE